MRLMGATVGSRPRIRGRLAPEAVYGVASGFSFGDTFARDDMNELSISTRSRTEFIDITSHVARAVSDMGVADGAVQVFVPHTTAGVTINENADPDVMADVASALERAVPSRAGYRHGEGNAAAHVKASLMGSSVLVPVVAGQLRLGTWQGVYFCEFDGPRSRRVWVSKV